MRRNSATELLLGALPCSPIVTVQSAAGLLGRSQQAVNEAIPRLHAAGVLRQTTVRGRNRAGRISNQILDIQHSLERHIPRIQQVPILCDRFVSKVELHDRSIQAIFGSDVNEMAVHCLDRRLSLQFRQ